MAKYIKIIGWRQWVLSDLIEKEKGYRNVENSSDNESNNEESSSDIEN